MNRHNKSVYLIYSTKTFYQVSRNFTCWTHQGDSFAKQLKLGHMTCTSHCLHVPKGGLMLALLVWMYNVLLTLWAAMRWGPLLPNLIGASPKVLVRNLLITCTKPAADTFKSVTKNVTEKVQEHDSVAQEKSDMRMLVHTAQTSWWVLQWQISQWVNQFV